MHRKHIECNLEKEQPATEVVSSSYLPNMATSRVDLPLMTTIHKRKRNHQESDSDISIVQVVSDDDLDIFSALTGKKQRASDVDDDEDLRDIIQDSITKRNVKGGTDVLKKTKGKTKLAKGEVGGGSFQSMGVYPTLSFKNRIKSF